MPNEQCDTNASMSPDERLTVLKHEWLARRHAGQACELWDVRGGTEAHGGLTVLWVPTEQVVWAFTADQAPTWYFSPFSRKTTLQCLVARELHHYLRRLEGYVPLSRRRARDPKDGLRATG